MDSHIPCVCRLIFIKMLKHLLILGLFLPTLFCRFIFQDNSNGNARSSILENNFLDVERELSMASEIAGILENRRLSRVRVSLLWVKFDMYLYLHCFTPLQSVDSVGSGLRNGQGTLSITNHLDILRERLLRQIAKNRSKKPVKNMLNITICRCVDNELDIIIWQMNNSGRWRQSDECIWFGKFGFYWIGHLKPKKMDEERNPFLSFDMFSILCKNILIYLFNICILIKWM